MPDPLNPLAPRLARGPLLLDGGLATELEARGADLSGGLWSARCLLETPEKIQSVHSAFLEAGADCLITATYQASFEGFKKAGVSRKQAEKLMLSAVALARRARENFLIDAPKPQERFPPLVAASLGPFGASLADGSEYTGIYGAGIRQLETFHRDRLRLLTESGADLLACETLPNAREIEVLADLLAAAPFPSWLSFSCRDAHHLADGTPLAAVVEKIAPHPSIVAVGVNCLPPSWVSKALRALRGVTSKPLVAYPNRGETYEARTGRWLARPEKTAGAFARGAQEWLDAGAMLVGGCCRTGPQETRALRQILDSRAGNPSSDCLP